MTSQNFDPLCDSDKLQTNKTALRKSDVWQNGAGGHFGGIFSDCFTILWPDGLRIREKTLAVRHRKLKPWFETKGCQTERLFNKCNVFPQLLNGL